MKLAVLLASALAFIAGFADGSAYIGSHLFAANMTGNTVLFGLAVAAGDLWRAIAVALPIAAFVCGAAAAQVILRSGARHFAFLLEAALLAAAGALDGRGPGLEIIAVAMGVQNTSLETFAGVKANTSFITGNYNRIAKALVELVSGNEVSEQTRSLAVLVPLTIAYASGAGCAGFLVARHAPHLLLYVVPLVLIVAGVALRLP